MRVAIVNDSGLALETLRRIIAGDARFSIAWTARDGAEAVRRCSEDRPDVVLMDLLMPVMNGAEATRQIMQRSPCAVLVVTSTVAGNFDLVCQALSSGAFDAVCTPVLAGPSAGRPGTELLAKLERVERINRGRDACAANAPPLSEIARPEAPPTKEVSPPVPLVAIGASTGGPAALESIVRCWPAAFPAAVVIAQHIAPEFAGSLADWLDHRSALTVRVAAAGDRPQAGTVLLANGAEHLVMTGTQSWAYSVEPCSSPYRPSVDVLFQNLAAHWPWPALAVLLTGIGRDGAQGLLELRHHGWYTVAQDEASSVVYGMPQAARLLGAARCVLPLHEMGSHIAERVGRAH